MDYFLYNSEGVQVANRTITADTSKLGFTLPTANLKAGKYRVVFLGKHGQTGASFGGGATDPYLQIHMNTYWDYSSLEKVDLFYSNVHFEVGGEDSYVEVNMKRPGGRLKILIEDEWPSDVTKIGLSLNGGMVFYQNSEYSYQSDLIGLTIPKKFKSSYEIVN